YLGKIPDRAAEQVKRQVESILGAKQSRSAMEPETAAWLGAIPDDLYGKLVATGAVPARQEQGMALDTLGAFLAAHPAAPTDVKRSTGIVFGHTHRNLIEFFGTVDGAYSKARGERKTLASITEGDADSFRRFLLTKKCKNGKPLAINTVNKRCQIAKQFFRA